MAAKSKKNQDPLTFSVLGEMLDVSAANPRRGEWTTDSGGLILSWDPGMEFLTSMPAEEAVGRTAWEVLGRLGAAGLGSPISLVKIKTEYMGWILGKHPSPNFRLKEYLIQTDQGEQRWLFACEILQPPGVESRLRCLVEDVTQRHLEKRYLENQADILKRSIEERKNWEKQLKQSNEELRLRLQERNRELARTNADLRQEIQERRRAYLSEKRARHNAEILRTASLALSSTLDLSMATQTLLEFGDRLVHFDGANISLIEHNTSMEIIAIKVHQPLEEQQNAMHDFIDIGEFDYLGKVLEARKSVWIADTRHYPGWRHYTGQSAVLSWLGVPLMSMERVIGLFALEKGEADYFSFEQVRLIEALAAQASVTIQNAWLFDQVRAGRQRLQALSRKLVEIQETERRYVARELHDETSQALTSLMVGLRILEREANEPENIRSGVAELQHMLQSVVENLHRLAMDLRPASLDHLGLVAALRQYIDAMSDKHSLIIRFEVVNINQRLPPDMATAIYRIIQEALTNIVRHARATQVDVILEQREGQIVAVIEDNGIGFNPHESIRGERLGLFGMRERAEMFSGKLIVESVVGVGTTIVVEVPYAHSNSDRG
jgi:signal transduction histidine kinase